MNRRDIDVYLSISADIIHQTTDDVKRYYLENRIQYLCILQNLVQRAPNQIHIITIVFY